MLGEARLGRLLVAGEAVLERTEAWEEGDERSAVGLAFQAVARREEDAEAANGRLGSATRVDVEVRLPGGRLERFAGLEAGTLPLRPGLSGTPDLARVGHAGRSRGAYTSHAVGGAVFDQGTFRDARIRAIAPISPQGPGGFGAFDRGPDDSSWRDVPVPAYSLVGSLEKDGSVGGGNAMPDWRLYPFNRYRVPPDRFLSVLPGQDHGDMVGGPPEVKAFVAQNTRRVFEVYVAGRTVGACDVGFLSALPATDRRRKGHPAGLELFVTYTLAGGGATRMRRCRTGVDRLAAGAGSAP